MHVTVQTSYDRILTVTFVNFNNMTKITRFLMDMEQQLEENESVSIYSHCFDNSDECYKLSLSRREQNGDSVTFYRLDKVDIVKGEQTVESLYNGEDVAVVRQWVYQHRKHFNQGFMETV